MPNIDGFEATQRIRAYERGQNLSHKAIIALTAHALEDHIQLCHAAGMDGHLAKPLRMEQLREIIAAFSSSTAL